MIECRPIVREEAPAFLRLLCDVFDLDYARAQHIFYSEPFYDLRHKWAYLVDGELRSILTTVPLVFGIGEAVGIAGVATSPKYRNKGLARRLLETVLATTPRALLFARKENVYRSVGFEVLDEAVRAPFVIDDWSEEPEVLMFEEVRERYDRWAVQHPLRLRRDDRRWNFWKWNLRMCCELPGGYICQEGDTVRELIFDVAPGRWPILETGHWYGLRSMAERFNLPLGEAYDPLMLMGRGFDEIPQMFMTDQF